MKRKRGGKRVGRGRVSSIKEDAIEKDEIIKCEESSIEEEAIKKCEGLSTQEDEITKCEGSSMEEDEKCEGLSTQEDEITKCEGSSMEEDEITKYDIDENDRISKLADELIHHILSTIDMKLAVQTCILAKRWRYIGTSLPTIKLDYSLGIYGGETDEDDLNKILISETLESRKSFIQRFHVNLPMYYERPVDTWISAALKANVQDVCISHSGNGIEIPEGTFSSDSLKKLTLVVPRTRIDLSKLPGLVSESEFSSLPSLEYLKLDYIPSTGDEEEVNKLVSNCPIIEYLDLTLRNSETYGDGIKIHSPTLKHLKICKHGGRSSLSLYAPKLVSLTFESAAKNNVYLEDVSSLVNAKINAKHDGGSASDPTVLKTSLEVLHNVQCLTISVSVLQDMPGLPEFLEKHVPEQFGNLRVLKLLQVDFSWSSSAFLIASFLARSPNIEELTLDLTRYHNWESVTSQDQLLKSELETLSVMLTLNKLKNVEVYNFQGSGTEMKILEILLRKAGVLETFDICGQPEYSLAERSVRKKIHRDLTKIRKDSGLPTVPIWFDTYKNPQY